MMSFQMASGAISATLAAITGPTAKTAMIDFVGICAIASIAFGSWLAFPPAGFVVGGALVLTGVMILARQAG